MSDELALTPQDFSTMTPDQILKILDSGWPWPLDAVQEWFEDLWDMIQDYFWRVVDWVYDRIKPAIDRVWDWIQGAIDWITSNVSNLIDAVWDWLLSIRDWLWSHIQSGIDSLSNLLNKAWDWVISARDWLWERIQPVLSSIWSVLGTIPGIVTQKIGEIKTWFSGEFIDPFIDWLVQLPKNLWNTLDTQISIWWRRFSAWWSVKLSAYWAELKKQVTDFKSPLWITWYSILAVAFIAVISAATAAGGAIVAGIRVAAAGILRLAPAIWGWLGSMLSSLWIWIQLYAGAFGGWLVSLLPRLLTWLGAKWFPLFSSALVLGLGATGKLDDLIAKFITPKMIELMDWAESMGPVAPGAGLDATKSVTNLITFTISGLATMTLMSEALSPFKHLGMGHISAMLYDVSNYKILTGAFVSVLAYVYVRKPLEYYYNKIARPEIPNERALTDMVTHRTITRDKFAETMSYHGYPDEWIALLEKVAYRPLTPRMLNSLAEAGVIDEAFLDRVLRDAEYHDEDIPFIKDQMRRLAAGELKTLMISVAMKRYREGLDDQAALSQNLLALGVKDQLIPKYLFGAELDALTDYQLDLLAYYKDAYHRREINDTQFLEAMDSIPLDPGRSELIYNREKIKRLKVASTPSTVVKTLTAAQIGALYKRDKLTKEEAIGRLGTYLPIATDRTLFLSLYEPGEPELPTS